MDNLPHDPQAEKAIIGAIFLDNANLEAVRDRLKADSFYLPIHRKAYAAMLELSAAGHEIDPLTVADRLRAKETLRDGDAAELGATVNGLPYSLNLSPYVEILRRHAKRRWLIRLCNEGVKRGLDSDESEEQLLAWIDGRLETARSRIDEQRRGPRALSALHDSLIARYEKFYRGVSDAVPTGFSEIDDKLTGAGLNRSALILIAARPSIGKTTWGLDICANAVARGQRALFFSLEMSAESLADRLVAVEADVPRWKFRPQMREADYNRAMASLPSVCNLPLTIDDSSYTLSEINRRVREAMRRNPVDLIVVDYLQLVGLDTKASRTRNDDLGEVSRALKLIAMEWKIPVIALSQLSRACEQQNREPELRDLRDSGELEQNADIVFFLFGDKPEEQVSFRDITIKCAKQREGPLFRTNMPFNCELVTFRSMAHLTPYRGPELDDSDPRFVA